MSDLLSPNKRILLVDDNPSIHDDFKRVLWRDNSKARDLDADAAALFGYQEEADDVADEVPFELDSALQGEEALEKVKAACEAGNPYAVAFVDMRMPPGWDGLKTIEEIWKVDSNIQIVICTAYSDRSWKEIQKSLTERDRWLVVKKPFDQIEVVQLAHSLTCKWDLKKAAGLRMEVLEQIVASRTEQLTAALQTNSDFLIHVSHEMLTPMNGIFGYLDLLSEPNPESEKMEYVKEARESSEQLLRLVNQVLSYNEAGSDEVSPVTIQVELNAWLESVLNEDLRTKASERNLSLNIQIDPAIRTQYHLPTNVVEKVLLLLLDNATKFTQSGVVEISVQPSGMNPSDLFFKVSDTGTGLTPEQVELVKIPFAQIDSSLTRSNDGIGIGLPLARRLLKVIGSSLEIESLAREGTCASFHITSVKGDRIA
jgi:signal transduction histidine kinase